MCFGSNKVVGIDFLGVAVSTEAKLPKGHWEELAKSVLKGELKRRGITYKGLAERLATIGVQETDRNLANKISRGTFTAAFLLQCLCAIEATTIHFD